MKYLLVALFVAYSCSDEIPFTQKNHEIIKSDIAANYKNNKQVFQSLAKELESFKVLRAINFRYGVNGSDGIDIYCDSLGRAAEGYSFVITKLTDLRLQKILVQEGITEATISDIQQRFKLINCNSFYTYKQLNAVTGRTYIHIEFKFNEWNGSDYYYYKLFDKKMEPGMVEFFNRKNALLGTMRNTGDVLDSNAVWYLPTD